MPKQPSPQAVARIESAAWIAIYAGMFAIILGIASHGAHVAAGWSLGVLGSIAVAAGVVLIIVRSRMPEPAQPNSPEGKP